MVYCAACQGALTNGASREEIIYAAMQAVLMHGGPVLMYMIPVEKALDEFITAPTDSLNF